MHYVGLDIHKKSISSCVRQADGTIVQESTIAATHQALDRWMEQLPQPWVAGMEATMFTGWIYDHLNSRGAIAKVISAKHAFAGELCRLEKPKPFIRRFSRSEPADWLHHN